MLINLHTSSAHQLINIQIHTNSQNHPITNLQTHINPQTHKLTKSSTQKFTYSSTQKFKFLSLILQNLSIFHSVLAKIQAIKLVKSCPFWLFTPFHLSIFENKSCILHHLAFLDRSLTHNFSTPTTCFQHLKTNFFMTISAFSTMFLMV